MAIIEKQDNGSKEQGYLNLKAIHSLQVNGAIQSMLRDIRVLRTEVEAFAKKVSDVKKTFVKQEVVIKEPKVEVENITAPEIEPIVEIKVEEQKEVIRETTSNLKPVFENKRDSKDLYQQRPYNNQNRFVTNNNSPDKFNKNPNFQNNRPNYVNRNNGVDQGNRNPNTNRPNFNGPRNPQSGGFNRPYNNNNGNMPNNNGQQRPLMNRFGRPDFQQRPAGVNKSSFVASKGNNYKSFAPTESATVLAQPERSFGNKNKNPNKNIEEKKQQSFAKKLNNKASFIIEDDDGFNETTMGSRKLVKNKKKEEVVFVPQAVESAIITSEEITVKVLSEKTGRPVAEIIKKLMMLGIMATINSVIDYDTAELVASDFNIKLEKKVEKTYEEKLSDFVINKANDAEKLEKRPPVVTIMGHVDHGKTSLLDKIRESSVASGEAGGITQHIGAYQVEKNGEKITFIDTPGHAAFTSMRARGAKLTDIAILIVAADDGVKPQTEEAISHIKAANVPLIVAINKMDKMDANVDKTKQQLADKGVLPEEWGGDAIIVPISAKTGEGIEKLLSMILLVAEMQNLKANSKGNVTATVIEALLDKNKGPLATILVQNGTLKIGDNIVAGLSHAKIRAMYDENGKQLKVAGPSCPVSVLGFDSVPNAGDKVVEIDEKFSRKIIEERKSKIQTQMTSQNSGVSLDDFMDRVNEGKLKSLNIIIKADVQGSVEALKATLGEIKNEEAKVVCLHSAAGPVTESDVLLASASKAVIICFNLKPSAKIKQLAEQSKIEIKEYSVIYNVVEDLEAVISGMLTPVYEEKIVGHAEVRIVFKLSSGIIAGSYVKDGIIKRNAFAKVLRGDEVVAESPIEQLKIMKDDKAEVSFGYECGIKLRDFTDFKENDVIECYIKERVKRA